jgi:mannosyl-3-phosphoglycerate phosphatase
MANALIAAAWMALWPLPIIFMNSTKTAAIDTVNVPGFEHPRLPIAVFTDLDSTLLDHDTYEFAPALPALQRLHKLNIPLIPTSSKTVAEMLQINRRLNNPHPFIAENGCIIALPEGYFDQPLGTKAHIAEIPHPKPYTLLTLAALYADVIDILQSLRRQFGFPFQGFDDLSTDEVAELTQLSPPKAKLSKQRLCSEPLLWLGDEASLDTFRTELQKHHLHLLKGGRFWHVFGLGNSDAGNTDWPSKGLAMRKLLDLYQEHGAGHHTTIALGDSPNDIDMLHTADIAIVIRRKDGTHMNYAIESHPDQQLLVSDLPGPAGWNETVSSVLAHLETDTFE